MALPTVPTFSVGNTGYGQRNPYAVKTTVIGDADASGNAAALNFSQAQGVMRRGDLVLCKRQDGALIYHTFDAERSMPGYIVLRRS